jgi:hypothetical protein
MPVSRLRPRRVRSRRRIAQRYRARSKDRSCAYLRHEFHQLVHGARSDHGNSSTAHRAASSTMTSPSTTADEIVQRQGARRTIAPLNSCHGAPWGMHTVVVWDHAHGKAAIFCATRSERHEGNKQACAVVPAEPLAPVSATLLVDVL